MTTLDRNEIIKQSAKKDSYWRGVWRRLKRNRLAIVSAIILIIIALASEFRYCLQPILALTPHRRIFQSYLPLFSC